MSVGLDHLLLDTPATRSVLSWVRAPVASLGLCPFARRLDLATQLRIVECTARTEAALLEALEQELATLDALDPARTETTIVVITQCLADFEAYLSFTSLAEDYLAVSGWAGRYQLASFHPHYQFAGTKASDRENLTNRSPYPLLHLLREESVTRALAAFPDAGSAVPARNVETLRSLPKADIARLWPWAEGLEK